MKRGFKALAVLAAVAAAVAGPNAFAVCTEFGGFAIFQCAERAWFDPKPAAAGTVSSAFWQLGYGNNTLNSGSGSNGTGNSGPTTFNGNDNGNWVPDLLDARAAIGDPRAPIGGLCLNSNNNWADNGVDGCADNFRDTALPGGTGDDGILNPDYNVYYARSGYPGVPSTDWHVDYPMGFLLRESTGHFFAFAVTSTTARFGPNDVRVGDYNLKYISNGNANPFFAGTNNIVPWQRVPGDRVAGDPSTNLVRNSAYADPNNKLSSNRILDLGWNAAVIHTDNGSRPSTNATVTSGGVGTANIGGLLRYTVQKQAIVNPADPYGSLNPAGWLSVTTVYPPDANAQVTVAPDTCVRLVTSFGREPQVSGAGTTTANCRLGKCGDVGYDVAGAPACIGGPLVADGRLDDLVAGRAQGKVRISFKTQNELNVRGFTLYAVTKKGSDKIGDLPCNECTTGAGSSYNFTVETAKLKGARYVEVEVLGTGTKFKVAIR